jgi:excisionase family DNA binding protein
MNQSAERYYTAAELAAMLRCSRPHVTNLIRSRKLGGVYVGHRVLVPESALEDFMRRGAHAPQEAVAA